MTCCPSTEALQRLLADDLPGPEAEAVEAHVEACAACQQALEELTGKPGTGTRPVPHSREQSGGDFLRRLEKDPPAGAWPCRGHNEAARDTKDPNGVPKPRRPAEPTGPYHAGYAQGRGQAGGIKVALVAGSGSRPTDEIPALLRRRLLFVALVSFLDYALTFVHLFFQLIAVRPFAVMLALTGGLALLLWSRRPLSFRALRGVEIILFGSMTLFLGWLQYDCFASGGLLEFAADQWDGMFVLARAYSLAWVLLIVLYGILIPNTWRRCAAFVGTMAVCPLLISAVGALLNPPPETHLLVIFLLETAFVMIVASAVAIYGSHRIHVLGQQALEARKLGQYRLKRLLGAGGMGEVYLAEHVLLKRPCALKVIRPERTGDPRNLARFEREVRATAALTHPNTVEVFDYGHADDGTFYYVMEYLPGLSLEELVKQHGPLPPARAVHLLRQVCGALQEAHAAGLIHRDIKPGNILVGRRGGLCDVAKLLDFGLVRADGLNPDGQQLTQEGAIAGTPAYMSPEQADLGDLDGRSDIYSLGAVAYFLLTGQPPFVRGSAVQTLAAHLGEAVVPPDRLRAEVPADLQAVLLRCLEKEPAGRFQDAASLEQALGQCGCAAGWTQEQAAAWWRRAAAETRPVECVS
jgi:tRNA A-37 threonylcarbamoyl transferase component Bud32